MIAVIVSPPPAVPPSCDPSNPLLSVKFEFDDNEETSFPVFPIIDDPELPLPPLRLEN